MLDLVGTQVALAGGLCPVLLCLTDMVLVAVYRPLLLALVAVSAAQSLRQALQVGCYLQVSSWNPQMRLLLLERALGAEQRRQGLSDLTKVPIDARKQLQWHLVVCPSPSILPASRLLEARVVRDATTAYHCIDSLVIPSPTLLSSVLALWMPSVFGDVFEAAHGGCRCVTGFIMIS